MTKGEISVMTRKAMKAQLINKMGAEQFEKRFNQLYSWNSMTGALKIMMEEQFCKNHDSNEYMHHVMYGIG